MLNIKFSYLYRDGANYKNFGSVIFANPDNIRLIELEAIIRSHLIDGTWFYAHQWQLPNLYFHPWSPETDHTFHEFESIGHTDEPPTGNCSIANFIQQVKGV